MGIFFKTLLSVDIRPRNYVLGAGKSCRAFFRPILPTGVHFRAASWENRDFGVSGHFGRVLRQGENAVLHHFKWKFKNEWSFCAWAIHNYFFALNLVF